MCLLKSFFKGNWIFGIFLRAKLDFLNFFKGKFDGNFFAYEKSFFVFR